MKIEEIPLWEAFEGVAKFGNFSKASAALRVPLPQLSKRVAKLESALGVRLFQRSTRVVSLTDEGRALLPKIRSILEDLSGLESSFENQEKVSGTLRLTSIPYVAQRLIAPILREFMMLHPDVKVEIDLSDSVLNLIESNVDLAVRVQEPGDTELVYRKLLSNDLVFCASPQYLKTHTQPLSRPEHLRNHDILMLRIIENTRFSNGAKLRDFVKSQPITCNNGDFLKELAIKGFGVLVRSIWDVRENLERGELVEVLKSHRLEPFGSIYAVIPSRRLLTPRVRAFMDLLVARSAGWKGIKR